MEKFLSRWRIQNAINTDENKNPATSLISEATKQNVQSLGQQKSSISNSNVLNEGLPNTICPTNEPPINISPESAAPQQNRKQLNFHVFTLRYILSI